MTSKALGKNPLFQKSEPEQEPVFTEEEVKQIREENIVSDVDEFTTMSFKVRKTHLKTLRDYAYTNRLEIKEALDNVFTDFFDKIDTSTLLEVPEKPKKNRKRG